MSQPTLSPDLTCSDDSDILESIEEEPLPPPRGWSAANIKAAERNCHIAAARSWMHNAAAANYIYFGYFLHAVKIALSAVTSSTVGIALDNGSTPLMIITLVCGIGIFIVEGIHTFYKISEKVSQHRAAAAVYAGVCVRLRTIQFTAPHERPPATKLLAEVLQNINDAENRSPPISPCYIRQCQTILPPSVKLHPSELRGFQTMSISQTESPKAYAKLRKRPRTTLISSAAYRTNYELERYFAGWNDNAV